MFSGSLTCLDANRALEDAVDPDQLTCRPESGAEKRRQRSTQDSRWNDKAQDPSQDGSRPWGKPQLGREDVGWNGPARKNSQAQSRDGQENVGSPIVQKIEEGRRRERGKGGKRIPPGPKVEGEDARQSDHEATERQSDARRGP